MVHYPAVIRVGIGTRCLVAVDPERRGTDVDVDQILDYFLKLVGLAVAVVIDAVAGLRGRILAGIVD